MSISLPVLQSPAMPEKSESNCDSIVLPELHQGILDWEQLDCVLADLDDFAQIEDIAGREANGLERKLDELVAARDLFVTGELHGLQIHYKFADQLWVDTLLREATGARLVRMPEQAFEQEIAEREE